MGIEGQYFVMDTLDAKIKLYANMCAYFAELRKNAAQENITDSPYPYVKICNYIRDIAGYQQCRMICEDNQKIYTLVTSDIHEQYFEQDISNDEIKECIAKPHKENNRIVNDVLQDKRS